MTKAWHSLSLKEIYQDLKTSSEGLNNNEARKRLRAFGLNEIVYQKKKNLFWLFLAQFKNPLIYILLIAAIITYFLKRNLDTWVILVIVFANAFLGFFHELKAEKAIEALKKIMALKAKVKRNKILIDLPALELVPGDIVEISSGIKIPADIRLIEAKNLRVDEAILTGESQPQEKKLDILNPEIALGDRVNMVFSGTMVISGHGWGIVTATGKNSEFGKISQEIAQTTESVTPLQNKLAIFSKKLIFLVAVAVSLIFLAGIWQGLNLLDMFLVSLAATISAIPEGLPAIITITLANGAFQMAKRQAIIRKLPAAESLGSITAIASDKTGTLTHNQMTVTKVFLHPQIQEFEITGSGYEPEGGFSPKPTKELVNFILYGLLCNNAEIFEENREWGINGDPTEGALVVLAQKAGIEKKITDDDYLRYDEIPFETEKGYMATLHHFKNDKNLLVVKGKIEKILEMSILNKAEKEEIENKMKTYAGQALRVMSVAVKEFESHKKEILKSDLEGLKFIGFAGMIDPPRKEAIEAIRACRRAKIRPIMITGDHSLTAKAIAQDMGLINRDDNGVLSGEELEKMSSQEFSRTLQNCSVFARISPGMKLKIVKELQKQGQIVAVTGDGINDAPALKKADIGVAMGEGGTDAAREISDLILADNNFATIIAAIEEGRTILQNIKRVVFYLLSTNIGELLIIFSATLLFANPYNLPLLPVQILWLNLVTDSAAGFALAFEPTHRGILNYPPRQPQESVINLTIVYRIILVASIMLLGTLFLYQMEIAAGASINRARTIAFAAMSIFQILNMLNCRSFRESIFAMRIMSNKYLLFSLMISLGLTFFTVYLGIMQQLFNTVALSFNDWIKIFAVALSIIIAVEIEKFIRRKMRFQY